MSYLIAFAFIAILGSLAFALYFMMKDGTGGKAKTSHMARALAIRVGLSLSLFLLLMAAYYFGLIPGRV